MTEVSQFWDVSRTRRFCALGLVAIVLPLTLTNAARAGAWEEFETRCLVPVETAAPVNVDGLERVLLESYVEEGFATYTNAQESFVLLSGQIPEGMRWSCALLSIHYTEFDVAGVPFEAWAQEQKSSGRYTNRTENLSHAAIVLRSTEWRDPPIEVVFNPYAESDGPYISVVEIEHEP